MIQTHTCKSMLLSLHLVRRRALSVSVNRKLLEHCLWKDVYPGLLPWNCCPDNLNFATKKVCFERCASRSSTTRNMRNPRPTPNWLINGFNSILTDFVSVLRRGGNTAHQFSMLLVTVVRTDKKHKMIVDNFGMETDNALGDGCRIDADGKIRQADGEQCRLKCLGYPYTSTVIMPRF